MLILGLAIMTESAACLLEDGRAVAAVEQERLTRRKHDGGTPLRPIEAVLEARGCSFADVDHVAVYWNPYKLGFRARYMLETAIRHPLMYPTKLRRAMAVWRGVSGTRSGWWSVARTRANLARHFGTRHPSVHFLDHHECHMATCFYPSPFEACALMIMDGAGEKACTTLAVTEGLGFRSLDVHPLPHSLGHFYSAATGYLGFRMMHSEYKVMGLSPYGDRRGSAWIREHLLIDRGDGRYALNIRALDYHRAWRGDFRGAFADHFGPPRRHDEAITDRHRDVAASVQAAFEDAVLALGRRVREETGISRAGIAGGCALNGLANGRLLTEGVFDEIYVPSAPHDAGGALGAAMLLHQRLTGDRPAPLPSAQIGPAFDGEAIGAAIASCPDVVAERLAEPALLDRCATTLVDGGVVAWFQGGAEFGPRALGGRSFLADPRRADARDALNERIKKREPFRPFAPSVKLERVSEYFELDQASPNMSIIVPVRPDKRSVIPAVTHVDGSARPQTVDRAELPRFWGLLDRFEARTGVPLLLNTSFNIQEPIVCTPQEALATFLRSSVEALAIGDYWVTRRAS